MMIEDLAGRAAAFRRVLSGPAPSGALPGLGGPSPSRYAFEPDPALRAKRLEDTAALMAAENPEGAAALRDTDVFAATAEAMRSQGLDVNDLADVFGSYLGQFWELANGAPRDADKARLQAITKQAAAILDQALTDDQCADRAGIQALSDALAVQLFVYGVTAFRLTQDWRDQTRQLADNYHALAKDLLGLDLRLFTFDRSGLVAQSEAAFLG